MTKIRIQNKAEGDRGVYEAGELVFIAKGATRTFSNMTESEIAEASAFGHFRVQGELTDGGWEELSDLAIPKQRPFLAIASDAHGAKYRLIDLHEGEWYVGTAITSDEPENAEGFDWAKIGGSDATPLTEQAAIDSGQFDPVAFLDRRADQLDFTDKPLELLLETERANKNRKGVVAALEELLTEPN